MLPPVAELWLVTTIVMNFSKQTVVVVIGRSENHWETLSNSLSKGRGSLLVLMLSGCEEGLHLLSPGSAALGQHPDCEHPRKRQKADRETQEQWTEQNRV